MPLHNFICDNGHLTVRMQSLNALAPQEPCAYCSLMAEKRFLSFPAYFVQQDVNYQSPVDGRVINSRQARLEDMARNNCVEYDPAMKDDHMRRIAQSDEEIGRKIEHHFDAELSVMPTRKKELLEQELRAGADLEFTRSTL